MEREKLAGEMTGGRRRRKHKSNNHGPSIKIRGGSIRCSIGFVATYVDHGET